MTENPFNNRPEGSRPESSRPERARRDIPRSAYNPITLDDLRKSGDSRIEELAGLLDTNSARSLGALLLVVMFAFSSRSLPVAPIIIVALLGGLLYRMSQRQRLIAGAPLTFATVRLAMMLAVRFPWWENPGYATKGFGPADDLGIPWMPLFLAVCLFYMPVKDSYTSKVVFWESLLLLLSGLLPGDGYAVIFVLVLYTLFLGMAIAIVSDLGSQPEWLQPDPRPAAQPMQA